MSDRKQRKFKAKLRALPPLSYSYSQGACNIYIIYYKRPGYSVVDQCVVLIRSVVVLAFTSLYTRGQNILFHSKTIFFKRKFSRNNINCNYSVRFFYPPQRFRDRIRQHELARHACVYIEFGFKRSTQGSVPVIRSITNIILSPSIPITYYTNNT